MPDANPYDQFDNAAPPAPGELIHMTNRQRRINLAGAISWPVRLAEGVGKSLWSRTVHAST